MSGRNLTVPIREQASLTPDSRVDREAGVIYGLKLLGRTSKNNHGVKDNHGNLVEGTEYTPEAVRKAAPHYEGLQAYANHPPRSTPNAERDMRDSLGVYTNTRESGGEIFGDLNLVKSREDAQALMDAAENPVLHKCFACSHNAYGRGEVKNRKFIIAEIPESSIRSVDIVARGGSCATLFESEQPMKITVKSLFAKTFAKASPKVTVPLRDNLTRLLEMDEYGGMEMNAPPPDEAEPPAGMEEEKGWEHHLGQMIVAVLKDEAMDVAAKAEKIIGVVKEMLQEEEGDAEPEAGAEAEESEEEEVPPKKGEKKEEKEMKESLRLEKQANKALRLLMESGVKANAVQIKAVSLLESESDMKTLIATFSSNKNPFARKPSSQSPGEKTVKTTESKEIDLAEIAKKEPGKLAALCRN